MKSRPEMLKEVLERKVRGGLLGPAEGMAMSVDEVGQDKTTGATTFNVGVIAVADILAGKGTTKRYLVQVEVPNKEAGDSDGNSDAEVQVLQMLSVDVNEDQLKKIAADAHLGTVTSCRKVSRGVCSVTNVVQTERGEAYVVQLRLFGDVASMNQLQNYILAAAAKDGCMDLPVPRPVTAATPYLERPEFGVQLQITEFVEGIPGEDVYYDLGLQDRISVVQQMARAHARLWELPVEVAGGSMSKHIGEVRCVEGPPRIQALPVVILPDRDLNGPFSTPSEFLAAWIRHRLVRLENRTPDGYEQHSVAAVRRHGIVAYRTAWLARLQRFVRGGRMDALLRGQGGNRSAHLIKNMAKDIPVVLQHADFGLHNTIFAGTPPIQLRAVFDWEFLAMRPFAVAIPEQIEPLFHRVSPMANATTTTTTSWDGEDILRKAFWDAIPVWRDRKNQLATTAFLAWYQFGRDLNPGSPPPLPPQDSFDIDASAPDVEPYWAPNAAAVAHFLELWEGPEYKKEPL